MQRFKSFCSKSLLHKPWWLFNFNFYKWTVRHENCFRFRIVIFFRRMPPCIIIEFRTRRVSELRACYPCVFIDFHLVVSLQWHISYGFILSFALIRVTREFGFFFSNNFCRFLPLFWNIIHNSRFNTIWHISYGFSLSFALQLGTRELGGI